MPNECDDAQLAITDSRLSPRTFRIPRLSWLCVSVVMAAALVTGALTTGTARAATTATTACPSGNLCLYRPDGTVVKIKAGKSADYEPNGITVTEIDNATVDTYCVWAFLGYDYKVTPGEIWEFTQTVYMANYSGGTCPI